MAFTMGVLDELPAHTHTHKKEKKKKTSKFSIAHQDNPLCEFKKMFFILTIKYFRIIISTQNK